MNEITKPQTALAEPSIGEMMQVAIQQGGAGVDALAKLVDLKLRIDADNARRAYAVAFCGFKAACPEIPKSSVGEIVTKSGRSYSYKWAKLEDIQRVIDPILSRHGLSYSFNPGNEPGNATATLVLRHVEGHSETFGPFAVPTDSAAAMQPSQKSGSALSFAKRNALSAALSLLVGDPDTDGDEGPGEFVTSEQANELGVLCRETGSDVVKFLAYAKAETFDTISAAKFATLKQMLESKRGKK